MRKRQRGRKFNRESGQRRALLKGLARALVLKGKIKTTEAKAKEVSSYVEKLVSLAKKGDLSSRRRLSRFFEPKIVGKLMQELAPLYQTRHGGCTRVVKLGRRLSDGSKMALIEFVK